MINPDDLEKITYEWFKQMQNQYPNEILEVTQSAIDSIKDLYELCQCAIKKERLFFIIGVVKIINLYIIFYYYKR